MQIMKTLIFNGSPRKDGDTVYLINELTGLLNGECNVVNAYYCDISPCVDCRYCREHPGCAVNDDMQEVYEHIRGCDNIVIASPLHFSELTGKLLCVGSRLQTYYCSDKFRQITPIIKPKKGGIILVGGSNGKPDRAVQTATAMLHTMSCRQIYEPVCSLGTDEVPAAEDKAASVKIHGLADFLNKYA